MDKQEDYKQLILYLNSDNPNDRLADLRPHKKIQRVIDERKESIEGKIKWPFKREIDNIYIAMWNIFKNNCMDYSENDLDGFVGKVEQEMSKKGYTKVNAISLDDQENHKYTEEDIYKAISSLYAEIISIESKGSTKNINNGYHKRLGACLDDTKRDTGSSTNTPSTYGEYSQH
ncbi:hypothetical protein KY332_02455 [Candidatus Woesearchaeota archaeon]|nr:hypothetical protein [Candidatus Woesearchaeota archaeon]